MTGAVHDNLLPRPPGGLAPGAALSLLVHAGLIAALTVAVDWRMKAPETVSAELWSALPQIAAPKLETPAPPPPVSTPAPVPPPPAPPPVVKEAPPPPPDITLEREAEKRRKEQQQAKKEEAAREKAEKAAAAAERAKQEAAQAKAEDARLAKARDEQMKRMLGSLEATGNNPAGTAAKDSGPSRAYVDKLRALLRNSVRFPDNGGPNLTVEVRVYATASGTIISHPVARKSGNDEFDAAVQRGLDRLGALPRDTDGRVPTDIIITYRLRDE